MPDKKLTDNEIVKTLQEMADYPHNYEEGQDLQNALDLINRLQVQNKELAETIHNLTLEKDTLFDKTEELKAEVERLKALAENGASAIDTNNRLVQRFAEIKSEAVKDFAERLKNEIINDTAYACDITQHSGYYDYQIKIGDIPEYIDNLVKEMVGEDNASKN